MTLTQKFTEHRKNVVSEMDDFEFQRSAESNKDVKLSKRCRISQIPKKYFCRYHISMNMTRNQNVLIDNKILFAS